MWGRWIPSIRAALSRCPIRGARGLYVVFSQAARAASREVFIAAPSKRAVVGGGSVGSMEMV